MGKSDDRFTEQLLNDLLEQTHKLKKNEVSFVVDLGARDVKSFTPQEAQRIRSLHESRIGQ